MRTLMSHTSRMASSVQAIDLERSVFLSMAISKIVPIKKTSNFRLPIGMPGCRCSRCLSALFNYSRNPLIRTQQREFPANSNSKSLPLKSFLSHLQSPLTQTIFWFPWEFELVGFYRVTRHFLEEAEAEVHF